MYWELAVGGELEEFERGSTGRIEIGWTFGYGRERVFNVIVRKEVVRTGWRAVVGVSGWGVAVRVSVQGL
jgi:hypothetical protein